MIRARAAAAALLLAGAGTARAEGGGYAETPHRLGPLVSLTWEASRPLGSLRERIDANSFKGGQVEIRGAVARHLSVGLATSWNWFSRDAGRDTVQLGEATITAPSYRRNQVFTLRATAHWYLLDGPVQPYVGAGVGAARVDTYDVVGTLAATAHAAGLAADPQAGFLIALRGGLALHLTARWQWTSVSIGAVKDQSWASVGVGLAGF